MQPVPKTVLCLVTAFLMTIPAWGGQVSAFGYQTPSYVAFQYTAVPVSESATNVLLTVIRTGEFREQTNLEFETEPGTAEDYFQPTGGTLVFAPGEGRKMINIPLTARGLAGTNQAFGVKLLNPGINCQIVSARTAVVITKDPPRLTVSGRPGTIVLSWPSGRGNFALQRSESSVRANWEAVPTLPVLVNDRYEYEAPANGTRFFYRLQSQDTN